MADRSKAVLHHEGQLKVRAGEVSVYVVRAFVKLREVMGSHKELAGKLTELEKTVETHDEHIRALFAAIRCLLAQPIKKRPKIGFRAEISKPGTNFRR